MTATAPVRFALFLCVGISVFGSGSFGQTPVAEQSENLRPLVEALTRQGCAQNRSYDSVAGFPCPAERSVTSVDPKDVLQTVAAIARARLQLMSLAARRQDAACSATAGALARGASVGPRNAREVTEALTRAAIEDITNMSLPIGTMLSIPGVTQVQYEYKGLENGPEVRTFRIVGHMEGLVDAPKLSLRLDGSVEGDPNLYVLSAVNYKKTRSAFPAWSPFLDESAHVTPSFKREKLDTLSATADFVKTGMHRNGVPAWQEYEYAWHAEKIGSAPTDILRQSGGVVTELAKFPYAGDWVGVGWGAETRFRQSRRQFVAQLSPAASRTMSPEDGADGEIMSLNVKHQTAFYFHVGFDGAVTGRGAIVYTLDPSLCALAVLTRQVNEQINYMAILPGVYEAARELGRLAASRFLKARQPAPKSIKERIDEAIRKADRIEPTAGMAAAEAYLAANPGARTGNLAFIDLDIDYMPKQRLWRPSGTDNFDHIPNTVPLPDPELPRTFVAGEGIAGYWSAPPNSPSRQWIEPAGGWWTAPVRDLKKGVPYIRHADSEYMLLEWVARHVPVDAKGTIKMFTVKPPCRSCIGVLEQFFARYEHLKLHVTSGG